jgi:hypothetical protein
MADPPATGGPPEAGPQARRRAIATTPLGSPVGVVLPALTMPNTTARNVPRPSTTQMTRRISTWGFSRKNGFTFALVLILAHRM